jgi:NADPH-dependent glutamate synthase beta subunit-like oxidoreductase/ferredoxin
MSTEQRRSEATSFFSPEGGCQPFGVTVPSVEDVNGYPSAPSAAACGALAPCRHSAQGCPLGVDIPSVARALAGGNHEGAFRVVRAAHPFASTCGSGCYAPCESACRRRPFGAPVAIAALEEFGASFSTAVLVAPAGPCTSRFEARSVSGAVGRSPEVAVAAPRSGKTIAIVGAGPAGLACANDLALLGHRAIVFDARVEPGGLMTGGIPPFRFPVASARAECAALLGPHVEFRGGAAIERLRSLFDSGSDAVFVAVGASRAVASLLETPQQHPDIIDAMDVLTRDIGPLGQTIVAGEGALAIDAARTLARRALTAENGAASSVQLVVTASLDAGSHTPALLAACARDGIRIHQEWRAKRVHLDAESGLLVSIDVAAPDGASARVLACDRLIVAPRRVPDTSRFFGDLEVTGEGFIATDLQTLRTSMPNVWAGGACVFGHRSVAHAVADGKRAAWEIHAGLTGGRVATIFASAWVEANGRTKPERAAAERRRALPLLEPPPLEPFASATPRAAARAGEEAARCFDCAQIPVVTSECTSCGRCADSCPTGAIMMVEKRPAIEAEICNRCGLCIGACPDGALTMLRAEWEERIVFS